MSNILSQNEIDELMRQMSGGASTTIEESTSVPGQAYRHHDFRMANKFSKEQMRTLNGIFENFAYLMSTRMTGILRTMCDVKLVSIEELRYSEYNNAISNSVVLCIIDAPPLQGPIMLQLSLPIAYAFVVRTMGGVADYVDSDKKMTEIEMAVVENMVGQMLRMFAESWKRVAVLRPTISRLENSPQFAQICSMNEPTALVTMSITIDFVEEIIAFCLPHYVIQPVAKKLNTMLMSFSESHSSSESHKEVLSKSIEDSIVQISAHFDRQELTLEDILWLKPGDVLSLDHSVNQYITVDVEDIPKFKGILGVSSQRQVVQIADLIKGEDEH